MEKALYPLKMMPLFKNKIWGGNKIKQVFGIDYEPLPNCGEMWLISGVEENESVIENGFLAGNSLNEVLEIYMGDLIGEKIYRQFGNEFPLLIKIIDANDKLSVQVHPDDELAAKRNIGKGKTEMWYVIEADKGAQIINGFEKETSSEEFKNSLENKTITQLLHVDPVEKGDVFFIPAKRIHALCEGILLAEIQQTSDTTYRVYDWDRVGDDGKPRTLHIDESMGSIDYSKVHATKTEYQYQLNKTTQLVKSLYFNTNLLTLDENIMKDFSSLDAFVIYVCVEGKGVVRALETEIPLQAGESVLLPAITREVEFYPVDTMKFLEVYIQE